MDSEKDKLIAELQIKISILENDLRFHNKTLMYLKQPPKPQPQPEPSPSQQQRTLYGNSLLSTVPEHLEIVKPGQGEKAALRGPRERKPSEDWDKDAVLMCYTRFMEILSESQEGVPIVVVAHDLGLHTNNAYRAKDAIIKAHPSDYVYVNRKPWPQSNRKLRGIMHLIRAKELGLEVIKLKEQEDSDA
jgi:hypothetical protein